jgi:diguanylate cyclase (GGDEF)-like protein
MRKIEDTRKKQIDEIISVAKLASLLFCGITIYAHFFNDDNTIINSNFKYYSTLSAGLSICILTLIYFLWSFSSRKKYTAMNTELMRWIENMIFILVFFVLVILSGGHESQYKLLFLFIIIISTIQSGMKHGVTVASVSSLIILSIDLIMGFSSNGINKHFENDLIVMGIFLITAWILGYYVKVENEYKSKLVQQANIDGLTGVYNHRYFHDSLKHELEKARSLSQRLSVILLDIDFFKHYNDLYGHQAGDKVLKEIGVVLWRNVRKGDVVARYGGEEFAIILPDTTEEIAISIAEKIRLDVEKTKFPGEENQPNGMVTASIGVSTFPTKAQSDIELIKSADDALYRAKFFNKNRVESYYSILEELKKDIEEEHIDLITSIKTLISVINAKDRYTYGHTERVVMYSRLLGDKLGISEEDKKTLKYGAYLHDIGKINIAKEILIKKMPLTNEEWETLKQHPASGLELIENVDSLKKVKPLILHHHERYDGGGYPEGLRGGEIPYLTRILTIADSFDAMTSNRPYNKRKTYDEALAELDKCRCGQFDPDIVKAFIEVIKENKDNLDSI